MQPGQTPIINPKRLDRVPGILGAKICVTLLVVAFYAQFVPLLLPRGAIAANLEQSGKKQPQTPARASDNDQSKRSTGKSGAADDRTESALPQDRVQIVGRQPGFATIQTALDAAAPGAVIRIGAGRFDERLKISKPVKLIGAGADKTTLGPTREALVRLREKIEKLVEVIEMRDDVPRRPIDPTKLLADFERARRDYAASIIQIEDVVGVELQSLTVTQPDTPEAGSGSINAAAIKAERSRLVIADCKIIGCMGNGISAEQGCDLTITRSLIAGVWGTGVSVFTRGNPGKLRIVDSDLRNCHHTNLWTGPNSDPCVVEECRISGSAYFGIRYGERAPLIQRNAIFDNARSGIYAEGDAGSIQSNLIWGNANGGIGCFFENKARIEKNVFLENGDANIRANGACQPEVLRNVFVGGRSAVSFGPIVMQKLNQQPVGKYEFRQNLWWDILEPLELRKTPAGLTEADRKRVSLEEAWQNENSDPGIKVNADRQVQFDLTEAARQLGIDGDLPSLLKSRWPLTEEEKLMIPDDGTRNWNRWKMRPRRTQN